MEPHIKTIFDEIYRRRDEAEEDLRRINLGDTSGMVVISENGFADESERVEILIKQTKDLLSSIEEEISEIERTTGQDRPL